MSRSARTRRGSRTAARTLQVSTGRGRHARPARAPRAAAGLLCSAALATTGATALTLAAGSGTHASASTVGDAAVAYAATLTGRPYVYGAAGPNSFDCSGFTMYVYAHFGVSLPHSSAAQYSAVPHVPQSAKIPGDLLFFRTGGTITHVAIYAGGNDMYAAPHTGTVTQRQAIYDPSYEVGRPVAAPATAPAPVAPPPSRNVYAVLPDGASGTTEVHGLSQSSGFHAFFAHAATALGPVNPADWRFVVAPYAGSGGPDLYAVHLRGTASGRMELHVLTAASGYRAFSAHIATAQASLPAGMDVDVSATSTGKDMRRDLVLVLKSGTGSGAVEVHVLAAATGYGSYLVHAATPIPLAGAANWTFLAGDDSGNGDLVGVLHSGRTGSGRTEVHVLSAGSGYRGWSAHVATPAGLTGAGATWSLGDPDGDGRTDVVLMLSSGTASGATEVHALGGSTGFNGWTVHAASALSAATGRQGDLTLG